jgi:chromosome segregation ATPase
MAQSDINFVFGVTGQDNVARGAKKVEQTINKSTTAFQRMANSMLDQANKLGMSSREYVKYAAVVGGATKAQTEVTLALQEGITKLDNIAKANQRLEAKHQQEIKANQARKHAIDQVVNVLREELATMGKTTQQVQLRKAALEGASAEQIKQIKALQESISAKKEEIEAQKQAEAQAEKEIKQKKAIADAIKLNKEKLDQRIKALKEDYKTVGMSNDRIAKRQALLAGATKEQAREVAALVRATDEKRKHEKATSSVNNSLRLMRGGFGQVGHQIQDVAVQMQMGTNAMLIFGQQGSQVASLFGQNGAMIGAFLAVGAAIYTYVNSASLEAEKSLKKMSDELVNTARSAGVLTEATRQFLIVEIQKELRQANLELEKLSDMQDEAAASVNRAKQASNSYTQSLNSGNQAVGSMALAYTIFNHDLQENQDILGQHAAKVEDQENKIKKLTAELNQLNNGQALGKTKTEEFIDSLKAENAVLQTQIDKNISAAHAQALYNLTQDEELKQNPMLLAAKTHQINKLFEQQAALNKVLDAKGETVESTDDEITASQKLAAKIADMTEKYGLNKEALLRLQAVHAAGGDSAVLNGLMAQIDAYMAKVNEAKAKAAENQETNTAFGDFEAEMQAVKDRANSVDDYLKSDLDRFNDFYAEKRQALQEAIDLEQGDVAKHNANLIKLEQMKNAELQMMQQTTAEMSNQALMGQFNQLASYFDQTTGIGKAFYVVQQGLAAADAIMKGYQTGAAIRLAYAQLAAATANPALTAVGEMKANMAVGMGYATAGAIAGQTLASFEGGGITFSGVRSGGLDGKGGRLAVVHSNEKITDLEKGGDSQPVQISFNISAVDSKGIDQLLMERRGMITSMVQKAVNNRGKRIM